MQSFVESFAAATSVLPGTAIPWVRSLRKEAAARFARLGLPTRKLEAWKYTDLGALRQVPWRSVSGEDGAARIDFIPSLFAPEHPRFRLVFVHGRARPDLWLVGELPGVTIGSLAGALNALRKSRGEPGLDAMQFVQLARDKARALGIGDDMLKRAVNAGFSGGEKKRNEILQMALLQPRLAILDETDSGLDIDALRIVADGVNALRAPDRAMLIITHYQRLLRYIVPDRVHVLSRGRIVRSGGKDLAEELEREGYGSYAEVAA